MRENRWNRSLLHCLPILHAPLWYQAGSGFVLNIVHLKVVKTRVSKMAYFSDYDRLQTRWWSYNVPCQNFLFRWFLKIRFRKFSISKNGRHSNRIIKNFKIGSEIPIFSILHVQTFNNCVFRKIFRKQRAVKSNFASGSFLISKQFLNNLKALQSENKTRGI